VGRGRDRLLNKGDVQLVAALLSMVLMPALAAGTARAADPMIAAAGDIACASSTVGTNSCHHKATSDLLVGAGLSRVLVLGDNQYDSGSLSDFQRYYDPTWGRVKSITAPALGNHEPGSASGYFDYFGRGGNRSTPPGSPSEGFYSFNVGSWHLIALNSKCDTSGGCAAGSVQEQWLRADLAAHTNACKLAYWHHPRFSSGHDHDNTFMQDIWKALYEGGVDVALTGHSHDYERFWPMDANGIRNDANGITQFVVGTGGAFFTGISTPRANSAVRNDSTYGVLKLTLHPTGYDWQFVPEAGKTFTDSGNDNCGGAVPPPADIQPPSTPANLSATAPGLRRVDLSWGASSDNIGVTGYEVFRNGSLIATTTTTRYTDNSVDAGTAYTYQVKARDAAGNRSAFSNSATVKTPGTTLRLPAQADALVEQASPNSNSGTATYLRADGGSDPDIVSYLRFNVIGVSGRVESAKLRVYALNGTGNGPAVQTTTSGWSETQITWNNRPGPTSAAADDKGTIVANTWVEYDVTPFVTASGFHSFVLAPTSSDGVDFASRENSTSTRRPQLVLSVTDTLVDNGSAPNTVISSGPTGATNAASASFEFSSSEAPAAFECRLDSGSWDPCSSPWSYSVLAKGSHTFSTRATDQFGNVDPTPATRSWSVVFLPSASFVHSPATPYTNETVEFSSTSTVTGTDTIVRNEWDLDGNGSFETNTGATGFALRAYPVAGTVNVKLRVTDNDGDSSTATRSVTVTQAPLMPPPQNPPPPFQGAPDPLAPLAIDTVAPRVFLRVPARHRVGNLRAFVSCDEPCTATGIASISIGRASARFRAKRVTRAIPAAVRAKLELRFSRKARSSVRRALARGKRVFARVELLTSDRAGNSSSAARKIRLRP
jgi:chitodextrinase